MKIKRHERSLFYLVVVGFLILLGIAVFAVQQGAGSTRSKAALEESTSDDVLSLDRDAQTLMQDTDNQEDLKVLDTFQ